MKKHSPKKFKKGAASIYIIVVTTMLFGVITISFIHLISSEMKRSSENNLSRSAYDSALAGVEDAKLAISEYKKCLSKGDSVADSITVDGKVTCPEILYYINYDEGQEPENIKYCDSVSSILGRNGADAIPGKADDPKNSEVLIKENYDPSTVNQLITQAYTCVKLNTKPGDYRSALGSTAPIRIVPLRAVGNTDVAMVRISWFSINNESDPSAYHFTNVNDSGEIEFNKLSESPASAPPTITAQLYQSGENFKLSDFSDSKNGQTNRGTLWLVPSPTGSLDGNPRRNYFEANKLVDSNDHTALNPNHGYKVECSKGDGDNEYACSADIELPAPIGGSRSKTNGAFFLALSLPYAQPNTDFKVEMFADKNGDSRLLFDNVQAAVDSTGRANELLSRIESRIELSDIYFPYPEYAIQLGSDDGDSLIKDFWVTYNCWTSDSDGNVHGEGSDGPCRNGDSGTED